MARRHRSAAEVCDDLDRLAELATCFEQQLLYAAREHALLDDQGQIAGHRGDYADRFVARNAGAELGDRLQIELDHGRAVAEIEGRDHVRVERAEAADHALSDREQRRAARMQMRQLAVGAHEADLDSLVRDALDELGGDRLRVEDVVSFGFERQVVWTRAGQNRGEPRGLVRQGADVVFRRGRTPARSSSTGLKKSEPTENRRTRSSPRRRARASASTRPGRRLVRITLRSSVSGFEKASRPARGRRAARDRAGSRTRR